MLGWVQNEGQNQFSSEKFYRSLVSTIYKRKLGCCEFKYLDTIEKAKKYIKKVRIFVYQNSVLLIICGVIGVIIRLNTSDSDFANQMYVILQCIRSASSGIAMIFLVLLSSYCNKLPEMFGLNIFRKFFIIQLGIMFTEIQPLLIQIFASADLIASTTEYTVDEIVIYTHSLLICTEMISMSFLLIIVFPSNDYEEYPLDKAKRIGPGTLFSVKD